MSYARGAEWRKWDLHVHTPASLRHDYGADPWDRYLTELAALPSEIQVLGINDYWFLEGYKRVREEFERGSLPKLHEVFPVLEFRTENFGGTDGKLRRINLHFICDPKISAEALDRQLISALKPRYQLRSDDPFETWTQVVSPQSLAELGAQIKAAVPPEQLHRYGSDLIEGFNNVCVPYDQALGVVRDNSALKDHVLLAVGKTEWASVKWNDQSIATKKSLLNSAHVVFTAAGSRDEFLASRKALLEWGVNARLLDCSDAHTWADSTEKDRLGNSLTWINADPTFKGLQHAIQEYDHRVSVEARPHVLSRLATRPGAIVSRVNIAPGTGTPVVNQLFKCSVDVNPGYVVILGNKGQGKSALLDIIGAAANSDRFEDYSFLTTERFRRKNGEAQHYVAGITWADGSQSDVTLDSPFDPKTPVRVDYLPQSLIERVCLADPQSKQKRQFEAEIERVVFGHVPSDERENCTSLRQMVEVRSQGVRRRLEDARLGIADAARRIVGLEDRKAELEALALDARSAQLVLDRGILEGSLAELRKELAARQEADGSSTQEALKEAEDLLDRLKSDRASKYADIQAIAKNTGTLNAAEAEVKEAIKQTLDAALKLGKALGLDDAGSVLKIELDEAKVVSWRAGADAESAKLREIIGGQDSGLGLQIEQASSRVSQIKAQISDAIQGAESLLIDIRDLEERLESLMGDTADASTIRGVQALLDERDGIPDWCESAKKELRGFFFEAHSAAMEIFQMRRESYASATDFVAASDLTKRVELEFDVELNCRGFISAWCNLVNKRKLADISDALDDRKADAFLGEIDLSSAEDLFEALGRVQDRLSRERGAVTGQPRQISTVVRTGQTGAQLLASVYGLSWLEGEYVIRSSGKELAELSPGQRGLVLLMFYLLVDKSDRPLLLDQPEENLDNQTVRDLLIPALRDAIRRRQVIVVTHNPNLAVVGDADQIIVAHFDGQQFRYSAGSLEQQVIGSRSIDVLEGTRAAFRNRKMKYDRVVGTGA